MGRVLTNNISLAYAIEDSIGVLLGTEPWNLLEPNDITTFGATITTTERNPISRDRQRKKGTVTDLDSAADFEHDITLDVFIDFIEGFVFSTFVGLDLTSDDDALAADNGPPEGFSYTAIVGSALIDGHLVYTQGFKTNAVNNGLFEVDGANSSDSFVAVAGTPGIVAEVPAAGDKARLQIAGWRFTPNSVSITVTGTSAVLAQISGTQDYTTIGLTAGQLVHVGGVTTSEQFSEGAGYARVVSFDATTITLDKLDATLVTDDGTADTVDMLFGPYLRNVPTDDISFLERSFQFEAVYTGLQNPGPGDSYEYSIGNLCNSHALNLPLADKATITFGFIGTNTEPITDTRKTGAATPTVPYQTTAYNTSSDIARLRLTELDEAGLVTCFKSITLTLGNNVSPEKCLGTLGAEFMNTGNFNVDLEAQALFTNKDVSNAVRNNTTVTMDFLLTNDNGGIAYDIPAMTLGGGDKEFPVNESVLINLTGTAFRDPVLGTSIGVSLFPILPQ